MIRAGRRCDVAKFGFEHILWREPGLHKTGPAYVKLMKNGIPKMTSPMISSSAFEAKVLHNHHHLFMHYVARDRPEMNLVYVAGCWKVKG